MPGTGGLALEQAPPLDLPERFFLTAPLFAAAAGFLVAWEGEGLLAARWTPGALAVVHLLAVGFVSQVLCGALLQMLPVLAGSPVPRVRLVGASVHLLLSAGTIMLGWGLWRGGASLLAGGACTVALGFLLFAGPVLVALIGAQGIPHTVRAIRIAVAALVATVLLGLLLTGAVTGWLDLPDFARWVDAHAAMGLLGWVGVLIVGVAYQVVSMFYVTSPYPERLARWLAPVLVSTAGAGGLVWVAVGDGAGILLFAFAVAGFVLFAAATMRLLIQGGRQRIDVTRLHWWAAMIALCAAAAAWSLSAPAPLTGVLLLVGVGVGLPTGMLLKILPFLSWFHLQQQQLASGRLDLRVPYMRGFVPERSARFHFALHLCAIALLAVATVVPALTRIGGLALGLSALFLEALLLVGAYRYQRFAWTLRTASVPAVPGDE